MKGLLLSFIFFFLVVSSAQALDLCGPDVADTTSTGNLTSPGFPGSYSANLTCSMRLVAPDGLRLRLRFETVDIDGGDLLQIVDQNGMKTEVSGFGTPKDLIGSTFRISFTSDATDNGETGFALIHQVYARAAVTVKESSHQIDLKPGKALQLFSNDYPMLYDDNMHYIWNITSSSTNAMVMTVVAMDTELQRDWLVVTGVHKTGESELLLQRSGTLTEDIGQIKVQDIAYVMIEFTTDYSRSGHGFHIIIEPDSAVDSTSMPPSTGDCGRNVTLDTGGWEVSLPAGDTSDHYCTWRLAPSTSGSRLRVTVEDMDTEEGTDYLQISSGLDPTLWSSYRRRLTGVVDFETVIVDGDEGVTLVFASGSTIMNRTATITVHLAEDTSCSGVLNLDAYGSQGKISLGNFTSDNVAVYCQWLVHTPILSNMNVRVMANTEANYDMLEIGSGSDPTDIASRQKLLTGDVMNQTFATFNGDLWVVFRAEDHVTADDISIQLVFDNDACLIETLLDLSGTIESPRLPGGFYPDDADCQWIVQVRGGYQVRLRFEEFDLEYGHDELIIGGTEIAEEDVDSSYLVLTGSEMPGDVISRFNGLNLRFTSDSSGSGSGFRLTYQEFFDCPSGYAYNTANDTCYKFVSTPASWWDARYDCTDVPDGDLVVVGDQAENDYVVDMIRSLEGNSSDWWIGYNDAAISGVWSWVDCPAPSTFADGNWQANAPNDTDDDHCAFVSTADGKYNDASCEDYRGYVCEITRKTYVDSDCYPSDFRVVSVGDYEVSLAFNVSEYLCDVAGYKVRYNTSVPGEYVEFDIVGAESSTITISGLDALTTYLFELTTCTVSFGCYGYSTSRSALGTTVCPTNYEAGPTGNCYWFRILDRGSWWATGRRTCDNEKDSDLVIIDSQDELDFLTTRAAEVNPNMTWWVGFSDQSIEGDWRWTDCDASTDWQSGLWMTGSPSQSEAGRQDCAALRPEGDLVDLVCDETLSYICEIQPKGFELTDANPSDLAAVGRATSIDVTWSPSMTSCDVVGYRVTYWMDVENAPESFVLVYGGDKDSATIDGLMTGTSYNVTVNAFLSQDYELSRLASVSVKTYEPIILQCSALTMAVTIPLEQLGGATEGADLYLLNDPSCGGVLSEDGTAITITTNLTECGNTKQENDEQDIYSNTVVERAHADDVISRIVDVYVPFSCAYNRTGHVGMRSYQLQNYRINQTEESTGQYAFSLDIYKDGSFEEKYSDDDYPVDLDLNGPLYFGASVPSQEATLDLSITRCVATPSSSYNDDQYIIIDDGCVQDETALIGPDNQDFVGVSMSAFRFVGLGNRVYLHCDLLVCDATGNGTTECDVTCPGSTQVRQRRAIRRDVRTDATLARKRVTQGPLRFARSAMADQPKNTQDVKSVSSFNPWVMTIVAMGTIFLVLLTAFVVMMRKMTSALRHNEKVKCDGAFEPLLGE